MEQTIQELTSRIEEISQQLNYARHENQELNNKVQALEEGARQRPPIYSQPPTLDNQPPAPQPQVIYYHPTPDLSLPLPTPLF